ncbi:hypothetical protein CGRA01v4_12283 [Colletotrichum graminicola]|nr:hypothetical protein CGRA01v4_12283 [Colletotrichum graminicola]
MLPKHLFCINIIVGATAHDLIACHHKLTWWRQVLRASPPPTNSQTPLFNIGDCFAKWPSLKTQEARGDCQKGLLQHHLPDTPLSVPLWPTSWTKINHDLRAVLDLPPCLGQFSGVSVGKKRGTS